MNEGMWFSYILGPAVDGIIEQYPRPSCVDFAEGSSVRCLNFFVERPAIFDTAVRSKEGGVEIATAVKDLFKVRLLAFVVLDIEAISGGS